MNSFLQRLCTVAVLVQICTLSVCTDARNEWTWLYSKDFSLSKGGSSAGNNELVYTNEKSQQFSQLICSWNGVRPAKGYYSFYVKARNARDKSWSGWCKMADWGANIQRSYACSLRNSSLRYVYVRLETGLRNLADAFSIKVVAHNGAPLENMKRVAVSVSDFNKFKQESTRSCAALPSVHIKQVPQKSQMVLKHPKMHSLCSPTSCSMVTSYLATKQVDPVEFAEKAYDHGLGAYGSWPFNVAHAFEQCNGDIYFSAARMNSFSALHERLQQGLPVVVSVRGHLQGAPKPYHYGHLLVVVGWDSQRKQVICHDPRFVTDKTTLTRYNLKHFLRAWERSNRLSYVAERRQAGIKKV